MTRFIARSTGAALVCALAFFSAVAVAQDSNTETSAQEIKQINPVEVCMVNDTVMSKPQIPVTVDGKTYYGCCSNCVTKLKGSKSARAAKDPHTGKTVDKAKAFIVRAEDGSAMYFESEKTAKKFAATRAAR